MGRVITGRGNVFNYKRGEMGSGIKLKPFDETKVVQNIQRGALLTKEAMKSPLLASGSPIVKGARAVGQGAMAAGKWAGEQAGLLDKPIDEAALMRARATGSVAPPAAPVAPAPRNRKLVSRPGMAAQLSDMPERIAELRQLKENAIVPGMADDYQKSIEALEQQQQRLQQQQQQQAAQQPMLQHQQQLRDIGPESSALHSSIQSERAPEYLRAQQDYQKQVAAHARRSGDTSHGLSGEALLRNPAFNEELRRVAQEMGATPQSLVDVFWAESSMRPTQKHATETSSGLIQIIKDRASEIGTTPEAIRAMSPVEQLTPILDYFKLVKRQNPGLDYSNPEHVDMAVFSPGSVGKPYGSTMYARDQGNPNNYLKNKAVDANDDKKITIQERLDWSARQARLQGSPFVATDPIEGAPERPSARPVTAQDLVHQRERVDSGAQVVPGVTPSNRSLGNFVAMARNATSPEQQSWVRKLVLEDTADLPWTSLEDLFTGGYKARARKEVEAAFPKAPKAPSALDLAKTDYYKAAATNKLRPKVGGRASSKSAPDIWKKPLRGTELRLGRLDGTIKALQSAIQTARTQSGSVEANEFRPLKQGPDESNNDFRARQKTWGDARRLVSNTRGDRAKLVKKLESKLSDAEYIRSELDTLYNEGTLFSSESQWVKRLNPEWTKALRKLSRFSMFGDEPLPTPGTPRKKNKKKKGVRPGDVGVF